MSDRSDRLRQVREDIEAIHGLDDALVDGLLSLTYTPLIDINFLEKLVDELQKLQAEKLKSGMRDLLLLTANRTSYMVSVLRDEEERLAASGKSFYLLRGRTIESTCFIIEKERDRIQKWEESGSLAGQRPPTPALLQLDALCTKFGRDPNLMIEMFKINRDRNAIAHDRPPKLNLSSTEAEIATFMDFVECNKSTVRRLEQERVIDAKTRELHCNIHDHCASYVVERVRKAQREAKAEEAKRKTEPFMGRNRRE